MLIIDNYPHFREIIKQKSIFHLNYYQINDFGYKLCFNKKPIILFIF